MISYSGKTENCKSLACLGSNSSLKTAVTAATGLLVYDNSGDFGGQEGSVHQDLHCFRQVTNVGNTELKN